MFCIYTTLFTVTLKKLLVSLSYGNYCSGGGVSAAAKMAVYSKELKQVFTDVGESLRI
jgi:hypothetical protein